MGTFDSVAWHPVAAEKAATHIAMFLGWAISCDLIHQSHLDDPSAAWYVARIKTGERTAKDFLADMCRNRLTDADLAPPACEFATSYYSERYLHDYARVFSEAPSVYDVEDTLDNLERIAVILDRRYAQYRRWRERKDPELQAG
jgi:hypothetical protein